MNKKPSLARILCWGLTTLLGVLPHAQAQQTEPSTGTAASKQKASAAAAKPKTRPTAAKTKNNVAAAKPKASDASDSSSSTSSDEERKREEARERRRRLRRMRKKQAPTPQSRANEPLVRGGIYDRPYIYRQGNTLAIGGYVEMLGQYLVEEGISDGLSFEARRFNLFVFSSISRLIRLTAELEYEHGTQEIALETALLDVRFHPALNLRGGILLVPLGRFNVAHDSPIYDVIDRPLVSTKIIPATYSDVGFGLFGAFYPGLTHKLTYEMYVINGLTSGILGNATEGTRIAEGKTSGLFAMDENGSPAFSVRLGYEAPIGLEVAASLYAGIYNKFHADGEMLEDPRWMTIFALDAAFQHGPLTIRAEFAWAHIDLPDNLPDIFASDQWGIYTDVVVRLWQGKMMFLRQAAVYLVGRFDFIDLNMGTRSSTGERIGDETFRVTAGISFRPTAQTSLRVVYQHNWLFDDLNNPARRAGVQFGFASYF